MATPESRGEVHFLAREQLPTLGWGQGRLRLLTFQEKEVPEKSGPEACSARECQQELGTQAQSRLTKVFWEELRG